MRGKAKKREPDADDNDIIIARSISAINTIKQ